MECKMSSVTGYYFLYDINNSGIYHLYEISVITKRDRNGRIERYKYNGNPLCQQEDSIIDGSISAKPITEEEFIDKIRNILNVRRNDVRLCENCIRNIIAERQDIFY